MSIDHAPLSSLERELSSLTRATGDAPILWKAALDSARTDRAPRVSWLANVRLPMGLIASAAGVLLCVFLIGVMVPSLGSRAGRAPRVGAPMTSQSPQRGADPTGVFNGAGYRGLSSSSASIAHGAAGQPPASLPAQAAPAAQDATPRLVIRKAQIELITPDVRAAFMKAGMLLSEAQGEFVEESGMSGADASLSATLKLRVAAPRLATVLTGLRGLGVVTSETTSGEDVTEQMVDLDARLRNEQRIEAELLALLESRENAPLEDILKVRESVGRVRENIERMTASRERLSRLVSLATILVVIRSDAAPAAKTGIGQYFVEGIGNAWGRGVRTLADSFAAIVRIAVGGLFGWIALAFGILALRLLWRRMQNALAAEPPPRL